MIEQLPQGPFFDFPDCPDRQVEEPGDFLLRQPTASVRPGMPDTQHGLTDRAAKFRSLLASLRFQAPGDYQCLIPVGQTGRTPNLSASRAGVNRLVDTTTLGKVN